MNGPDNHFIDREHPEYTAQKLNRRKYRDLYSGGEQFRAHASEYLVQRSKEAPGVYQERLAHVFYENYAGSIIDWYAATLMRREPVLQLDGKTESSANFYDRFVHDCDLRGTSLTEFFRQRMAQALVYGKSYIAIEFPAVSAGARTRAEEDLQGRSRAYLIDYSPEDIINWSYDDTGRLEWAVIRTESLRQARVTDSTWRKERRWIYYDRQNFQIYSQEGGYGGGGPITLQSEGKHGLARQGRVPLIEIRISEGLWLMNKAALLQLEHFNKSNALAWGLTMGLFAQPVVYSDKPFNQIMGESYYIQLGPEDKFGWTEPAGHIFQIASDNLSRLKEEIYRVCYLMNQAGGVQTSTLQSGLSKQRDFGVTHEILRSYGDTVKESMRQVLEQINFARQDGLRVDVSGLDEFDIGDFSVELDDAKRLLDLGIESVTLKQQLFKRLAMKYFCDIRQEFKNKISGEIDAGPDGPGKLGRRGSGRSGRSDGRRSDRTTCCAGIHEARRLKKGAGLQGGVGRGTPAP